MQEIIKRYPKLQSCESDIAKALVLLVEMYDAGGKLLICGNGGSAADAEHIAGELIKGFLDKRKLTSSDQEKIKKRYPTDSANLISKLQYGLPAISLVSSCAAITATGNDMDFDCVFAQQVFALGKAGDTLFAISTSGKDC